MIHSEKRPGRKMTKGQLASLICLIALIFQVALPVVHSWQIAIEQTAGVAQRPVRANAFAADQKDAWRSVPSPIPLHPSHDPALCPVCKALSHVREATITQTSALDTPTTHDRIALPLMSFPGGHRFLAAIPRAPPSPL